MYSSLNLIYKGILKKISERILLIERNRLEKIVKENGLHDLGPIYNLMKRNYRVLFPSYNIIKKIINIKLYE
jgi:hypothetical protein